jgi:hypothetical protein
MLDKTMVTTGEGRLCVGGANAPPKKCKNSDLIKILLYMHHLLDLSMHP